MACATDNLERTSYCIVKVGYFIVSLITLDYITSHNKITRKYCNNVSVIVDSFGMDGSSFLNKDLLDGRSKITIGIC